MFGALRKSCLLGAILVAIGSFAYSQPEIGTLPPDIEVQSGPITPGLVLEESRRPVHQVRLQFDAKLEKGRLLLDANTPIFDAFGTLVGGIITPQTVDQAGPLPVIELPCTVELSKAKGKWHLYRVVGPKIKTPLCIATKGALGEAGPTRVIIYDDDKNIASVIDCTQYGVTAF